MGTGDGRYVYRSARANPDKFYIGIDVQRKALEKVSERIHRKPEKGGVTNVLFVHAPVEELPAELDRAADEIHIHFPWGAFFAPWPWVTKRCSVASAGSLPPGRGTA